MVKCFLPWLQKQLLAIGCTLAVVMLPATSWAENVPEDFLRSIPNVQVGDASRYVTDEAHLFSAREIGQIDREIAELRKAKGIEIAVVTLPSLRGYSIEAVANALLRYWGIGSKTNNGLLILLSERKIRIEVGYGLEGDLPDAICFQVQEDVIIPAFKRGLYGEGIVAGIRALAKHYDVAKLGSGGKDADTLSLGTLFWSIYLILAGLLAFNALYAGIVEEKQYGISHPLFAYQQYRKKFVKSFLIVLLICPPIGILTWLLSIKRGRRLKNRAHICPNCHTSGNYGEETNPAVFCAYIEPQKAFEYQIRSLDINVYHCTNCAHSDAVVTALYPGFEDCPHCGYRAMEEVQRERIRKNGGSMIRTRLLCRHCGESDLRDKQDDSDGGLGYLPVAILGALLTGGGRGSSGRGSGGGWGGGSGGGGGSTGSW